ncbi:hypothetical protein [Streptomyces griseoviridis]|uniref:hypothetical protein n=1 Tax=Streptomyces griseoviridis TaxID=45398 RepID=UPI0034277449
MAFGAEELRVLRRALALALNPAPASAEDVQDCHRLAESLDEALHEGVRLRAFLVADLARYRAALPGTAAGYLTLLEEALRAGYRPGADDLAALRALRGNPVAATLLDHCQVAAEHDVRTRLARATARQVTAHVPASRTRLTALPGGLGAGRGASGLPGERGQHSDRGQHLDRGQYGERGQLSERGQFSERAEPDGSPAGKPGEKPAQRPPAPAPAPSPAPAPAKPGRPIPTPGEVFPRRKPSPPQTAAPARELAAG